ncbi:SagB/ThcOx family dehydrogenase [Legionella worsleiensis]|uniref:Putative nitroreductase n=1 Tax=Legionella worsleiensis TaxID=45076 RepID=A0A0W1A9I7_9GAMM|nr:SagB/ThcOx family dehydrogenase [Legionella worsleiensis]KTD77998.1 putative nitroreductase [Legionella worsleiensis]STY31520.1 putative nitroreductase [Legionella worsleiensis]
MQTKEKNKSFISCNVDSYLDSTVYNDVLKTYAKECITLLDYGFVAISSLENSIIEPVQFTECEISPFHLHDIPCDSTSEPSFKRAKSSFVFTQKKIKCTELQSWLINTFSPDDEGRRPYPSAGGLYPVEPLIFLFNETVESDSPFTSGCYHFRPVSKTLQLIKPLSYSVFYSQLLHSLLDEKAPPAFCILYTAHVGKAIFKYRYRGYRHAVMEAGSMYQLAAMSSQNAGLSNTVWSSFSEYELLAALDLDPGMFMPITMQLFGYSE